MSIYNRIKDGTPFDEELNTYTKLDLAEELKRLESEEEYEKCEKLLKYINERFSHEGGYCKERIIKMI